jgi:hypothetical protein
MIHTWSKSRAAAQSGSSFQSDLSLEGQNQSLSSSLSLMIPAQTHIAMIYHVIKTTGRCQRKLQWGGIYINTVTHRYAVQLADDYVSCFMIQVSCCVLPNLTTLNSRQGVIELFCPFL